MNVASPSLTLGSDRKKSLRIHYRNLLSSISLDMRREAHKQLLSTLYPKLERFRCVLSFASLPLEISLWPLNKKLIQEKKLALPRLEEEKLVIYAVQEDTCTLKAGAYGIMEPIPETCPAIELSNIDCILVPALSFDRNLNRLGKGKGHYDRFLSEIKSLGLNPHLIGVCFKEQMHPGALPFDEHDQKVDELVSF